MLQLITTLGPRSRPESGIILPHEHVFVDLRIWSTPGYAQAETKAVIALMAPELEKARAAGIMTIVEASTVGVGRRADILRAVSEAANFPLLAPTGVYREPWIPDWVYKVSKETLREWMIGELDTGIEESGVRAGWIKLSAGDDSLTPTEIKVLRAAASASIATNAVIGSHTIRGRVVQEQLDILEEMSCSPRRFIWIHAQAEPDFELHLAAARRGAWIEYDNIGADDVDESAHIERILRLLDAGFEGQILLSQDRGWFDPAQLGGGKPRPFTYLVESFLPRLAVAGVDQKTIQRLVQDNPFAAFAR